MVGHFQLHFPDIIAKCLKLWLFRLNLWRFFCENFGATFWRFLTQKVAPPDSKHLTTLAVTSKQKLEIPIIFGGVLRKK